MTSPLHIASPARMGDTEVSGCVCVSVDADPKPPFIGITGALHGNEPCGLRALEHLETEARDGRLPLQRGSLFLIHGNPAATRQGTRHTEGGCDLNRLFDYRFVDNLPTPLWASEHHRALALRPLLSSLDALLDLHSATAPTPPFAIVSQVPSSGEIARKLGLPFLTHGWEGPGLIGTRAILHCLTRRSLPSMAVECGQHEDPRAAERAIETALRFLAAADVLDQADVPPPSPQPAVELQIVDAVKKPSTGFGFHFPFVGLQQIALGSVLGSDDNLEIRTKGRAFVIMPNASVAVGEDMLYLAHQVDPQTLIPEDMSDEIDS